MRDTADYYRIYADIVERVEREMGARKEAEPKGKFLDIVFLSGDSVVYEPCDFDLFDFTEDALLVMKDGIRVGYHSKSAIRSVMLLDGEDV